MGCYTDLKIGSLPIGSDKNYVNPLTMILFQESDRCVFKGTQQEFNVKYGFNLDSYKDDCEIYFLMYFTDVSIVRDRLELIGITRKIAEDDYTKGINNKMNQYKKWRVKTPIFKIPLKILRGLDLNTWSNNLKVIADSKLYLTKNRDNKILNSQIQYMLSHNDMAYGYPGHDYLCLLRLAIDNFPDSELLQYDLTDLILGGYIDEQGNCLENEDNQIEIISEKIIILTEGVTDTWILQRSLKLLYPHLYEYFHFMDFEGANIEGGAGPLANIVKAFAGAGIKNKIIALFDNDTAANSAITSLSNIRIPNNIVLLRYPEIALANNYPTQGPTGIISMNVNGLAGSIELYLGVDTLTTSDEELSPIQWKGYDHKVKKYQGEIINKIDIQNKFKEKLRECELHREKLQIYDWTGLQAIFNSIRVAFRT